MVTSGLPFIHGRNMAEKISYAAHNLAWVPGLLLLEPRGHKEMFGAILTSPCDPSADFGVLFMDNQGYEPMCGHALIGVATSLIESGAHPQQAPETHMILDTAAGLVRARARLDGIGVQSVTFENVPAFLYRSGVEVTLSDGITLIVDVAFGGNFFILVEANQVGIDLVAENAGRLAELGMRILAAANQYISVKHPQLPHIDRIIDLRFWQPVGRDGVDCRNVVILGDSMVDRSPCGTGTCAEMAMRYARGQLKTGETFVCESIIGTRFSGQVIAETEIGTGTEAFAGVVPQITGSAYITGMHQFVLHPHDPFPEGFILK
jgi:proline racemase